MDNWVKSVPKEMREEMRDNIIVTGGCIVSMFLQEKVNDYDVYFKDGKFLIKYLKYLKTIMSDEYKFDNIEVRVYEGNSDKQKEHKLIESGDRVCMFLRSMGVMKENKKAEKYHPVMITDNAVSLKGDIQLISRFWGEPAEIHKNFDYIHVRSYWTYREGVITPPEALEAILTKELKYRGSLYPIASLIRMRKFIRRGWSINAGEIVKMAFQVSDLNLKDPLVLADQLMGVDMSYFLHFIEQIRKAIDEGKEITPTYVMEVLDEVFEKEHELDDEQNQD